MLKILDMKESITTLTHRFEEIWPQITNFEGRDSYFKPVRGNNRHK